MGEQLRLEGDKHVLPGVGDVGHAVFVEVGDGYLGGLPRGMLGRLR